MYLKHEAARQIFWSQSGQFEPVGLDLKQAVTCYLITCFLSEY